MGFLAPGGLYHRFDARLRLTRETNHHHLVFNDPDSAAWNLERPAPFPNSTREKWPANELIHGKAANPLRPKERKNI